MIDFLGQTGRDALKGADILRTAPAKYTSSIEYSPSGIAQSVKNMAQVMFADLGTQIYYTSVGSFDRHTGELPTHAKLWQDVSGPLATSTPTWRSMAGRTTPSSSSGLSSGRRVRDNGSGTDHGAGGTAFVIGAPVKGGMYGEFPSLKEEDQVEGDLKANNDFRSTYTTILERWVGSGRRPHRRRPVRAV